MYAAERAADRFLAKSYDVPRSFRVEMQEEAFAWLEKWLARGPR